MSAHPNEEKLARLAELANDAKPLNDNEWGSERQIDAQNRFFDYIEKLIPAGKFSELEDYCNKATTDEMIAEGLRIAREALAEGHIERSEPKPEENKKPLGLLPAMLEVIKNDDIDNALIGFDEVLGIESGDVAAQFWSGKEEDEWKGMSPVERLQALVYYVRTELNYFDIKGRPEGYHG